MKNELQIKKTDIDWLKVIKLALDRKGWGKSYTLYTYGDVTITAEIDKFYFSENKAIFKLKFNYEEKSDWYWRNELEIEYFLENFTVDDFKMVLQNKIVSKLKELILSNVEDKATRKFIDLFHAKSEINEEVLEEHGFLDDYNIAKTLSEDMEELVIDEIYTKVLEILNKEHHNKVDEYKNNAIKTGEGVTKNLYKLYNIMEEVDEK